MNCTAVPGYSTKRKYFSFSTGEDTKGSDTKDGTPEQPPSLHFKVPNSGMCFNLETSFLMH